MWLLGIWVVWKNVWSVQNCSEVCGSAKQQETTGPDSPAVADTVGLSVSGRRLRVKGIRRDFNMDDGCRCYRLEIAYSRLLPNKSGNMFTIFFFWGSEEWLVLHVFSADPIFVSMHQMSLGKCLLRVTPGQRMGGAFVGQPTV